MKPDPKLTEEQVKRHNDLYARANGLMDGLMILDGIPEKSLGFFSKSSGCEKPWDFTNKFLSLTR